MLLAVGPQRAFEMDPVSPKRDFDRGHSRSMGCLDNQLYISHNI